MIRTPALRVLLVEDSPTAAAAIVHALQQAGHHVAHALTAEQGLEIFQQEPPDLILMDVILPGMDGFEAARRIKAARSDNWIPLIMMTAQDSDADIIAGLEAGADEYLPKPVNLDVLVARMRAMQRIATIQRTLAAIIDNITEGVIAIDTAGAIQLYNGSAERIFGYPPLEVMGRNVSMLMPPPYKEAHDGYLARFLKTREPRIIGNGRQVEGRRKSGEVFPMYLGVNSVPTPEGEMFVGVVRDISTEVAAQERIEHLAWHDSLTGLANRASFHADLEEALRNRAPFSLMFIDLDGFKEVNDDLGHEAGDDVLVTVARRMRHVLKPRDLLARIGGDEFAILLWQVRDGDTLRAISERLLAGIRLPIYCGGRAVKVSASIGGLLPRADGATASIVLSHADKLMYTAKRAGKNRVAIA